MTSHKSQVSAQVGGHLALTCHFQVVTCLVLGGPLDAVDDEHVDWSSRTFELDSELLFQRQVQRRAIWIRVDRLCRRKLQLEAVVTRQAGTVEHRTIDACNPGR